MSKLSFRARALDASKPMPIYMAEELPDLPDYSAINRAVPQMPSGMEKEEECVSPDQLFPRPACFSVAILDGGALRYRESPTDGATCIPALLDGDLVDGGFLSKKRQT